jgi:hypothetical protein
VKGKIKIEKKKRNAKNERMNKLVSINKFDKLLIIPPLNSK